MKTIEFGPYLLLTLKSFRTVTLTVCAWWSTGYKESNTGGLLGLQPGDNNRILGLLLLKLITQNHSKAHHEKDRSSLQSP